jgi:AcrR family transcriptional regulator
VTARNPKSKTTRGLGAGARVRRVRADDMLTHALRLFAEVGYANTTVKSIAAAAGINPALLYYYYQNKEDLFVAALRHAIDQALGTHQEMELVERSADPAALIRYWFEKNRRLLTPLSQLLNLMLEYRTSSSPIPSVDRLIARFYDAEIGLLSRAIRRGIKLGQFRKVDVDLTALFISTHLDGVVIAATIRPHVDIARSLNHLERILFEHLAVGSKGESAPGLATARHALSLTA